MGKNRGIARASSLDILPPSHKGPSAELNPEENVVVPSIHTSEIVKKLNMIEKLGGRMLKDKICIGKNAKYGHCALFEDPNGNRMCLYSDK